MFNRVEHEKSFITSGPGCASLQSDKSLKFTVPIKKTDTKKFTGTNKDSSDPSLIHRLV